MDIRFDILIDYDSVKIGVYANQMNKMFTLDYLMYIEFIQRIAKLFLIFLTRGVKHKATIILVLF